MALGLLNDMRMKVWLALISTGALLCGSRTSAFEAIPSYQGGGAIGYEPGGAGFGFSPRSNITVTALGNGGDDQTVAVTLWDSNGLQLVSALVTSNSPPSNWARYETISPLTLSGGQTYYVSAVETNSGLWIDHVIWGSGATSNGNFTVGPGITYIGAALGTNADGTFPHELDRTNYLMVGPNFTYVTSTTLLVTGLQFISGQVKIAFIVSGVPAASFTLFESGQPGGPWATNLAAVLTTNVPGVSYTFTTPPGGPVNFYRVRTP
jgi:hypothetical protein